MNLTDWFEEHFEELGFEEILEKRTRRSPDFTCLKDGEEVGVELEMKSSNFRRHGHSFEETDFVVCLKDDDDLPINILSVDSDEEIETETNQRHLVKDEMPIKVSVGGKINLPKDFRKRFSIEVGDFLLMRAIESEEGRRIEIVPLEGDDGFEEI